MTKIQIRRGTSVEWAAKNPILASGELGYDITKKIVKVGNGTTAWNSLNPKWTSGNLNETGPRGRLIADGFPGRVDLTVASTPTVLATLPSYTFDPTRTYRIVHSIRGMSIGYINWGIFNMSTSTAVPCGDQWLSSDRKYTGATTVWLLPERFSGTYSLAARTGINFTTGIMVDTREFYLEDVRKTPGQWGP